MRGRRNRHLLSVCNIPVHSDKEPKRISADILTGTDVCIRKTNQVAEAVGIGVVMQVDLSGIVRHMSNLGWRNVR